MKLLPLPPCALELQNAAGGHSQRQLATGSDCIGARYLKHGCRAEPEAEHMVTIARKGGERSYPARAYGSSVGASLTLFAGQSFS